MGSQILFYLCKYNYYDLVDFILKNVDIDVNCVLTFIF